MITQKQVNDAINYLIEQAAPYEHHRDHCCRFESPEYWAAHDAATNLLVAAESLIPGHVNSAGRFSGRHWKPTYTASIGWV